MFKQSLINASVSLGNGFLFLLAAPFFFDLFVLHVPLVCFILVYVTIKATSEYITCSTTMDMNEMLRMS